MEKHVSGTEISRNLLCLKVVDKKTWLWTGCHRCRWRPTPLPGSRGTCWGVALVVCATIHWGLGAIQWTTE